MNFLYIFPHPDDESFGPSPAMFQQLQQGHQVHLLTLTRGGATKQRFRLNFSVEEMGNVRVQEMQKVNAILKLTSMNILDLEDGGLTKINPIELGNIVKEYIQKTQANIVVTYPQHGISGHFDHLTIHSVTKQVFCELQGNKEFSFLKRLAFFTLTKPETGVGNPNAKFSAESEIDCIIKLELPEINILKETLHCYETYKDVIQQLDVINEIGNKVHFEIWNENYKPVIHDLTEHLIL
ncbi:MAG: PIG-L family deacetylase [Bacteroidetes bacterium]|nr:PIG-L family deacetylase [Bacteroidota bacterium]